MSQYNGGAAAAAALENLGVDIVFGVPSQHNLALYDAIAQRTNIRLVGARHEAGALHQADGYARATGKLGVAIVSTGPGTANAMNGLYEAQFASSPVLLITTQVDRKYMGSNKGFIHDAPQQTAMLQCVSRTVHTPRYASQIAASIIQAAEEIHTGRPQPSVVEIPTDLLSAPANKPEFRKISRLCEPQSFDMQRLIDRLKTTRRPLLWVGGGCTGDETTALLSQFVDQFQIPVVSSPNGRAAFATDHPLHIGSTTHYPQFRELLQASDLVIAIGTRFQAVATWFWSLDLTGKLAHIDIDPAVIGRNFPTEIAIVADATDVIARLLDDCTKPEIASDFIDLAQTVKAQMAADLVDRIGPFHKEICDIIDAQLPTNKIIVCDATMTGNSWGGHHLHIRDTRGFLYSTSLAIGPALPLGIGAALGTGKKTVILHGDGGVMLNIAELATAVETNAPIILLVFNDRGYGVLRELQRMSDVPEVSVNLHTPDFVALGNAMGLACAAVSTPQGFSDAMSDAIDHAGPYLIEIDLTDVKAPRL